MPQEETMKEDKIFCRIIQIVCTLGPIAETIVSAVAFVLMPWCGVYLMSGAVGVILSVCLLRTFFGEKDESRN